MPTADRFAISFTPTTNATSVKVCIDWLAEPEISDDVVRVEVNFTPSGGSQTVELTAANPCADVPIPEGAAFVTAHDTTEPQWSSDHTDPVP